MGERVYLLSSSTGTTLSLFLAANDPEIDGILGLSPNIDMYDQKSKMLNGPWGLQLARKIFGGKYRSWEGPEGVSDYWMTHYRLEGIQALRHLVSKTMTEETFASVKCPVFIGYWYKNEEVQDKTISVKAILDASETIQSASSYTEFKAYPDAGAHVMISDLWNPNTVEIEDDLIRFIEGLER